MTFAPAMQVRAYQRRKRHNDTVRRVYRNWTPIDLAIYERNCLRARRALMRMVADDYADVILVTSRLILAGKTRAPLRRKFIPARPPIQPGQVWRKLYETGKFLFIVSPMCDPTRYAVFSCSEDGATRWNSRITRASTIHNNYECVRDV